MSDGKGDKKDEKKDDVKGLDDGSENEVLKLCSQEQEKFTVSVTAHRPLCLGWLTRARRFPRRSR